MTRDYSAFLPLAKKSGETQQPLSPLDALGWQSFFASQIGIDDYRKRAMSGEPIRDRRNADGSPTTNYMKKSWFRRGRKFRPSEGLVDTSKFRAHMLVAVKHNIPFFAVLPELVATGIPILGIVRDPIATILSWHETGLPVAKGWMPSAAAFWPELNEIMPACKTEEIGWARIYDALCQRLLDADVPILP